MDDLTDLEVTDHVGTELLFENDTVRVWEMRLEPGESSDLHRHGCDYLFVHLTPTRLLSEGPGAEPKVWECQDGFVQYSVVGAEGRAARRVTNVGLETHRQVVVELLGPSAAEVELAPQTNGRWLRGADT